MSDLAEWFAGISSPPMMNDPSPPTALVRAVGISEVDNPVALSDPLALVWCAGQGKDAIGIDPGASGAPMLCRGCGALVGGRCCRLAHAPVFDDAAYCSSFQPCPGVTVGRCWLWLDLPPYLRTPVPASG